MHELDEYVFVRRPPDLQPIGRLNIFVTAALNSTSGFPKEGSQLFDVWIVGEISVRKQFEELPVINTGGFVHFRQWNLKDFIEIEQRGHPAEYSPTDPSFLGHGVGSDNEFLLFEYLFFIIQT